jgi:hypothetical protein
VLIVVAQTQSCSGWQPGTTNPADTLLLLLLRLYVLQKKHARLQIARAHEQPTSDDTWLLLLLLILRLLMCFAA